MEIEDMSKTLAAIETCLDEVTEEDKDNIIKFRKRIKSLQNKYEKASKDKNPEYKEARDEYRKISQKDKNDNGSSALLARLEEIKWKNVGYFSY